ncbi:MAG: OadG family protein [Clostridia bacterium]|nr:OadG family protein [Clostridia bacterium]
MNLHDVLTIGENITSDSPIGERVTTGLEVMLIGMSVVFGVLVLLMAILYVFKAFAVKNNKKEEPAAVEPEVKSTVSAAPAASSSDDDTVVAVATAAIAAARGESDCAFNVISIKKIVK